MTKCLESTINVVAIAGVLLAPAILIYVGGALVNWDLGWLALSYAARVAITVINGLWLLILLGASMSG